MFHKKPARSVIKNPLLPLQEERKLFYKNNVHCRLSGLLLLFKSDLLLSTFFVFCTYIYNLVPFYTNVLYEVLPIQVWQIIGVGQYIFPVAVLWKIRASAKSWLYLLAYPIFIYSWVPIVMLGFLHRNEHEWNHTLHTRGISFDDVIIPEDVVNVGPKQVAFKKQ